MLKDRYFINDELTEDEIENAKLIKDDDGNYTSRRNSIITKKVKISSHIKFTEYKVPKRCEPLIEESNGSSVYM